MLPLVSIIIPIYNAENFIDRCLNSILNQSFKDYVVYMINDGSTDNTLNKLEYFSKNDSRFILINKENSGVSTTRNFGLNLVKTKYTVSVAISIHLKNFFYRSKFWFNSILFFPNLYSVKFFILSWKIKTALF